MKKVILKVQLNNEREKQKAMRVVSGLQGVDAISLELKDQKMTVIGDVDPVDVVRKLRKLYPTEITSVGPAKEPEKKKGKEKAKDSEKEEESEKKEGKGKSVGPAKESEKKEKPDYYESMKKEGKKDEVEELVNAYKAYNPKYMSALNADDDPNACVIC